MLPLGKLFRNVEERIIVLLDIRAQANDLCVELGICAEHGCVKEECSHDHEE